MERYSYIYDEGIRRDDNGPLTYYHDAQATIAALQQQLAAAQGERDEAAKDRDDWITSWRALQRHNERIESQLATVTAEKDAANAIANARLAEINDLRIAVYRATLDAGKEGQGE